MKQRHVFTAALVALAACKDPPSSDPAPGAASSSPPPKTLAAASAEPPPPPLLPEGDAGPWLAPSWLAGLPSVAISAKPGDRVFCAVPFRGGEHTSVGVREIASVEGDTATVANLSRKANKLLRNDAPLAAHVPGAVIYPARTGASLGVSVGDLVTAPVFGYGMHVVQVTRVDAAATHFKYAIGENVVEDTAEYVAPRSTGVAPFAWVAIKYGAAWKKGLVLAVASGGSKLWAWAPGESVRASIPAEDVKPLVIELADRKAGDSVFVFDAEGTGAAGKIERVVMPKWLFDVKVGAATKRVSFENLVDRL